MIVWLSLAVLSGSYIGKVRLMVALIQSWIGKGRCSGSLMDKARRVIKVASLGWRGKKGNLIGMSDPETRALNEEKMYRNVSKACVCFVVWIPSTSAAVLYKGTLVLVLLNDKWKAIPSLSAYVHLVLSSFQAAIPSKILPLLQLCTLPSLKSMWWPSPPMSRTVWDTV